MSGPRFASARLAVANLLRSVRTRRGATPGSLPGLEAVLAAGERHASRPCLVVLPTTHEAIRRATILASPDRWIVAERRHVDGARSPSSFLDECRRRISRGAMPPGAFLFSDQFVEAPHAVLLVQDRGQRRYLSAIELVAHACHGLDVHVWNAGIPLTVATPHGANDALRLLQAQSAYLQACDALDAGWLARPEQGFRLEATRILAAVHRVRRYESYLLQAYADSAMDSHTRAVLGELRARRREFLVSCRPQPC